MAQMVTFQALSANPNGRIASLRALDLSSAGYGFGLAEGHAVGADTFAGQVKRLPHVRKFHAPAMVLAWWGAAIELSATFIAGELLHLSSSRWLRWNRDAKSKCRQDKTTWPPAWPAYFVPDLSGHRLLAQVTAPGKGLNGPPYTREQD